MTELRAYKDMEPTYGELAEALKKLNFEDRSYDTHFLFINDEFDAIVLLPLKHPNAKVHRAHFAGFSMTLEHKGVLEHMFDLGKMIEKTRRQKKKAALLSQPIS